MKKESTPFDKLNAKLKAHPPTAKQTAYYKFSNRYRGYEFVSIEDGKVYSKFDLYTKAGCSVAVAESWIVSSNPRYVVRLKTEVFEMKNGEPSVKKFARIRWKTNKHTVVQC